MKKTISRQRAKQLRNMAAGLCQYCPRPLAPGNKSMCEYHRDKRRKECFERSRMRRGVPLDRPKWQRGEHPTKRPLAEDRQPLLREVLAIVEEAMKLRGVNRMGMAKEIGSNAYTILRGERSPRLTTLEAIASSLKHKLVVLLIPEEEVEE